jgi:hypothetical protein
MTPFEKELKQAMARRQPGADFTRRVLEQVQRGDAQTGKSSRWGWFRRAQTLFGGQQRWRLAAILAMLLVMSGSVVYEQHERAMRGEAAKQKLLTAVRIAGVTLHQVHRHVLEVEATEEEQ